MAFVVQVDSIAVVCVGNIACYRVVVGIREVDSVAPGGMQVVRGGIPTHGIAVGRIEMNSHAFIRLGAVICQRVVAAVRELDAYDVAGRGIACQGVVSGMP